MANAISALFAAITFAKYHCKCKVLDHDDPMVHGYYRSWQKALAQKKTVRVANQADPCQKVSKRRIPVPVHVVSATCG